MHIRKLFGYSAVLLLVFGTGCIQKRAVKPPVADKIKVINELHGEKWEDDYKWLNERGSEKVLNYLNAENAYTEVMTQNNEKLQTTIYNEIISRIKETDTTVSEKNGDYYYYTRTEKGKEYKIYCRKRRLDDEEEVILDVNTLADGYDFYSVDMVEVSPNGKMLAFAVDTTGREEYTIHFKDLESGKILIDKVTDCYNSMVWADNNKTVFYTVMDETLRPSKVYRHTIESKTEDDKVFEEPDGKFWVELSHSKSGKYLFINLASSLTSEIWYLEAKKEDDPFKLFQKRRFNVEYSVYHDDKNSRFFIVTNDGDATNFKIMTTPEKRTSSKDWKDYFPYDEKVKIDNLDMFQNYMVIYERKDGNKQVRIVDLDSKKQHYLDFGEELFTYTPGNNYEYKSHIVRITYSSLVTPRTVVDYNMEDRSKKILKVYNVPNYQKDQYEMKRLFATANDGTQIPISLVYKKGLKLNGNNPTYLYGYGAYGISMEPRFRPYIFSLLDRGFVYAIGHVRGGGEMGRTWYEDGKFLKKKNTFTDFIAVAEYLIDQKYTNTDELSISGGSAGGMLIGAVVNMRPDLFKVAVADVPFVDVLNTMLDPSIPLTVLEYEEWGNPNEKKYFDYMLSYSPYDNVKDQNYPNMLITAGLNDPRVQYWEPAKWTARLRAHKTDTNLLILKTNMGAGHMGASGRYEFYDEIAFEYTFVCEELGIKK